MKVKKVWILIVSIFLIISILSACTSGEQGTADTSKNSGGQNNNNGQNNGGQKINDNQSKKMSAEITQTAFQVWKDSIDTIWVHGAIEITNTGEVPIKIGDINISYIGDDNSILGTSTFVLPVPEIIKPGETAYAGDTTMIDGIDDPSKVVNIEAHIDFDKTNEEPQILSVQDLKIIPSDFGPKVTGRVVNDSHENADDIRIIVALLDENDKLLGIYSKSLDVTLAPGKNMGFEVSYPSIEAEGFVDKVKKMVGKSYNWTW